MTINFDPKNIAHWELRCNSLRCERNALYDLLRGILEQMKKARLSNDWLTISNAECAIDAALKDKP